jgi:hypothetical protein
LGHGYVLVNHVPSTALHCSCRIPLRYDVDCSSPHRRCTVGGKPPLRHLVRRRTTRRQCRVGPNEHVQNDRSVWRSVQIDDATVDNIEFNIRIDSYTAGASNGPTWVQNLADSTGAKLVNYAVSGT